MPVYKFTWDAFITDELLETLARICDVERAQVDEQRAMLAKVLSCVGGLPLAERTYTPDERTQIALRLLYEGLRHVISLVRPPRLQPLGFTQEPSPFPEIEALMRAVNRINLNIASAEALEQLPGVGPIVARRIVAERLLGGPFISLEDLDQRVKGVGPNIVRQIADLVWIEDPITTWLNQLTITDGFDKDFARFVAVQVDGARSTQLASALHLIATKCAEWRHPQTKKGLVRQFDLPEIETTINAEWISVLFGEAYYQKVPQLMSQAQQQITVCMFHIAYPSEDHPTHRLLEVIKDAHARGVSIRVLLDHDRSTDPYRSSVINSAAKRFFEQNGISCKYDRVDRLLHSKFITIDDDLTVVGSHNWSAGSYFDFDDLSLVLKSKRLNKALQDRFDKLWVL